MNSQQVEEGREYLEWVYSMPPDIADGVKARVFKPHEFTVRFIQDASGRFLLENGQKQPWRSRGAALSYRETNKLAGILFDEEEESTVRGAAAWRLGKGLGRSAVRTVLRGFTIEDDIVKREIQAAFVPLHLVYSMESRSVVVVDTEEHVGEAEARERGSNDNYVDTDTILTLVYDPGRQYSSEVIEQLQSEAEQSSSSLRAHGWLDPDEADSLYQGQLSRARDLLDSLNPLNAHHLLDPLLTLELKNNPEAWHLDALALLESATPGGRQLSEDRIRQALRLDPGNLRYLLALANIQYRRTFAYYAEDLLDRILSEAPTLAAAYALKSIIRLEYYWRIGWRASRFGGGSLGRQYRHESVYRAAATDFINKALLLDPDDSFATWWFGCHYLFARQWGAAIPVMNYLIQQNIHTAEAYLGRGLAFQHLGDIDQAMSDYSAGLALLPPHIRVLAEDPRWVLPPSQGGITLGQAVRPDAGDYRRTLVQTEQDSTSRSSTDLYWRSRDPLHGTEINERLLEQRRRFAYTTWFFAIPNIGLRGWETHRGRIYLRYGEPQEFQAVERELGWEEVWQEDAIELIADEDIEWEHAASLSRRLNLATSWTYPGIKVRFDLGWLAWNYMARDQSELLEDIERIPESTRIVGIPQIRKFPVVWYSFRNNDLEIEAFPAAQIPPLPEVIVESDWNETTQHPITHIVLDNNWEPITTVRHTFPVMSYVDQGGGVWIGQPLTLPVNSGYQGDRFVSTELVFSSDKPSFTALDTISIYSSSDLYTSSLVLADELHQGESSEDIDELRCFQRGDHTISPNITGQFAPGSPVQIYFEIYNLQKNETGATDYELAISVTSIDESRVTPNPIIEALGRLVRREQGAGRVTLFFNRSGIQQQVNEALSIEIPEDTSSGKYSITIEVTDLIADQTVSSSVVVLRSR
ncbi:GWxTD domain-containing protein [Gemmatimonadota bacterium]